MDIGNGIALGCGIIGGVWLLAKMFSNRKNNSVSESRLTSLKQAIIDIRQDIRNINKRIDNIVRN